jgi:hypothetical protein
MSMTQDTIVSIYLGSSNISKTPITKGGYRSRLMICFTNILRLSFYEVERSREKSKKNTLYSTKTSLSHTRK